MADFTAPNSERVHDNGDGTFSDTVFVDNAANSTVLRVTAGAMAPGQSAKQYVGKQATSTTAATTITLETVTTGKTFYITDILIMSDSASSATLDIQVNAAGVPIFRAGVHSLAPIDMTGIETQPFAVAGQAVTLVLPQTTAAQNVWFNIFGYEQ